MLRLAESATEPHVLVTASAGNHGRALAQAARLVGYPVTVYVPAQAPRIKLEPIAQAGATLVPCRDYDEAERLAREHGASGRATYISPYGHPDVIAGAGTIAIEILEQDPDVDAIVVPVGGGGLIAGVAIAAVDRARVFGVEAEASCPFTRSVPAGRVVHIEVGDTLADGLAGNLDPDTITFELVRRHAAGIVTVTEPEIRDAIAGLWREEGLVAEGAAATAIAAVATRRLDLRGRRVAVVLTGANIDPEKFRSII